MLHIIPNLILLHTPKGSLSSLEDSENVFSILRNKLNRSENKTYENIKSIVDDFLKINLEKELKNIFNHCAKMIEIFIEKNENK